LLNVRQLGSDRIVDFEFAGGELTAGYHIIVEFYASVSGEIREEIGRRDRNLTKFMYRVTSFSPIKIIAS
jgi:hypothetical protein